jgi:BlaI family penicillinase repressor
MGKEMPTASDAELDVLKVLWELGDCTVREVATALARRKKRRAYTTILTFLQRLSEKGYVKADRSSPAHSYRAVISQADLIRQRLCTLAKEVCDDSPEPVLRALSQPHSLSKQELMSLRKLMDASKTVAPKAKKRKSG